MNEEAHWDKIGANYGNEIFDVFQSDRQKRLPVYFRKHANPAHSVIDFGCGTGKSFPYLSPLFSKILAIDISAELLSIAKTRPYKNITFKRADLTARSLKLPLTDFAFCCNVVMLPEISKNELMLRNIQKSLKKGGSAVFVIPSAESILFASWRLIDWYRKDGVKPEKIPLSELHYFKGKKIDLLQGVFHIEGVPTKHYSHPEIEILFKQAGFAVTAVERLEYDWNTEFSEPPKWMGEPYPWDWLVECRCV
jgi:SAM-dependent methyltransferase